MSILHTCARSRLLHGCLPTLLALCLTACGGGGSITIGTTAPVPVDTSTPGQLKSATLLTTLAPSELAKALNTSTETQIEGLVPAYGVAAYRIEYMTTGAQGQLVRASGLVGVPLKAAGAKSPVLGYQHGTIYRDAEAPSNHAQASEVALLLASVGYIVVAPDYVGYGASKGSPHPFLLAAPSAAATLDMLTAAKTWRDSVKLTDNGQLFLAGYSEGAYVSVATQRALQANSDARLASLRLTVAGDGAYNVQATLDGLRDLVRVEQPALGLLLDPGLLRSLNPVVRHEVGVAILAKLQPGNADVVFDTRFIDSYLADDVFAIAQLASVHDWKPAGPIRFFHGRADRTVPYASASSTLQAMRGRGATDVSLVDCTAVPADHLPCVPLFMGYMLGQLRGVALDL